MKISERAVIKAAQQPTRPRLETIVRPHDARQHFTADA
jgi:hypothetical protein